MIGEGLPRRLLDYRRRHRRCEIGSANETGTMIDEEDQIISRLGTVSEGGIEIETENGRGTGTGEGREVGVGNDRHREEEDLCRRRYRCIRYH